MPRGGLRPGAGAKKKIIDPGLPPRKRGRPSNAERAARAAAEAEYLAGIAAGSQAEPEEAPKAAAEAPKAAGPTVVIAPPMYTPEMPAEVEPLDYFLRLMRDPNVPAERRDRAAQFALGYMHAKPGDTKKGKKEERADRAAELVSGGRFAPRRPPQLKAVEK